MYALDCTTVRTQHSMMFHFLYFKFIDTSSSVNIVLLLRHSVEDDHAVLHAACISAERQVLRYILHIYVNIAGSLWIEFESSVEKCK